jgi:acyl-CoA thioesterase FadM
VGSWHEQKIRVRQEETDTAGVMYYAKFQVWMEVGRVGLLRDIGFRYSEWVRHEIRFPVVQAHADYRAPARFDDEVLVKTKGGVRRDQEHKIRERDVQAPRDEAPRGRAHNPGLDGEGRKAVPFSEGLKAKLTSS